MVKKIEKCFTRLKSERKKFAFKFFRIKKKTRFGLFNLKKISIIIWHTHTYTQRSRLFCNNLHIFLTGGLTTSFCRITLVWQILAFDIVFVLVIAVFFWFVWVGNRNRFFCDDNSVQWHFFFISNRWHRTYNTAFFVCWGQILVTKSWFFYIIEAMSFCILHPGMLIVCVSFFRNKENNR